MKFDVYRFDIYVDVRNAVVSFLIIFNARRGGEPSRLMKYQWEEALNGEWLDKSHELGVDLETEENGMLVTFQTGKGKDHLVPVFFPMETHRAIKYLMDPNIRTEAGVLEANKYMFAATKGSKGHTSGWHCIDASLQRLSLPGAFNATKNRHSGNLAGKIGFASQ